MSPVQIVALLTLLCVLAAMIRIDTVLLRDLAQTRDDELAYLTRKGWAAAIVFTFPIGAILYLAVAKLR
ncbi:MAG TPA: hypothetical protein VFR11_12295 [Micromonosporaceae bacterium]|nr:hypothetical protein [Micromonosporaceae bacterium]